MEVSLDKNTMYELVPSSKKLRVRGNVFSSGRRLIIGRTDSADIVIDDLSVSAIHAVLEVTNTSITIFDMNSRNGTYVNGEKIVTKKFTKGDRVNFAAVEFILSEFVTKEELPPSLPSVLGGTPSYQLPETNPTKKIEKDKNGMAIPKVIALDPRADESGYIFEDALTIYPIFKYDFSKQAVEVAILHKDIVFSVDYLSEKNGSYSLVGAKPSKKDIEFPYLGVKDKFPFIDIRNKNVTLTKPHGYQTLLLSKDGFSERNEGSLNLNDGDMVKFINGDLEIFVRKVTSPPYVKPAPLFRRDKELKKYLLLLLFLLIPTILIFSLTPVDKEELAKTDAPKRIATILYKPQKLVLSKNDAVVKTPEKEKIAQKTKPKELKPEETTKVTPKIAEEKVTPKKVVEPKDPGVKTATKKQVVKKAKTTPAPKAVSATKTGGTPKASASVKSATESQFKGAVDVYKSPDFKSTVSSLVAKGGGITSTNTNIATGSEGISSATVGGVVSDNLAKANVSTDIGSLEGATVGKIGDSKGAEGLSAKKGIYTAGIPAETVVLGSMDPDVIRRILRQNIPFFKSCYDRALETSPGKSFSGQITLLFSIGASGHVTKAAVTNAQGIPTTVRNCVARHLKTIEFPRPLGGGIVEVKQPFNFMAQGR